MKKMNTIVLILFIATVILEVANIFLSNRLTTDSIKATALRDEISVIDEQNQNIRSEILGFTSFDSIASRAATLGFVNAKESISLSSPIEVASSQ